MNPLNPLWFFSIHKQIEPFSNVDYLAVSYIIGFLMSIPIILFNKFIGLITFYLVIVFTNYMIKNEFHKHN